MVRKLLVLVSVLAVVAVGAAMAQQGGCPMHAGAKAAGKAAPVKATTPAQKAYLAEAARLHARVVAKQAELLALEAKDKPAASALKAKHGELDAARKALYAYNVKNKATRAQLGLKDCSTCPKAGSCDGCAGTGCAQCANCPAGRSAKGGCPMAGAAPSKAKPAAGGCSLTGGCSLNGATKR